MKLPENKKLAEDGYCAGQVRQKRDPSSQKRPPPSLVRERVCGRGYAGCSHSSQGKNDVQKDHMLAARAIPHQKALPTQEIPRLQSKGRKTRGHGSRSWIPKLGMLEAGEGQWDSRALRETAVVQAQGHFGIERKMSICSIK